MPDSVLIICSDLFFGTQLRAAAERSGAHVDVEMQPRKAVLRVQSGNYRHLVIDLEAPGLELGELIAVLPDPPPQLIAFGPHVQEQRLAAAREAGCSRVVTRGQISANLPALLVASPP